MTKFMHLVEAQVAPTAVARFDFYEIEGSPWLEVRPAGEPNKGYLNAALKQVNRQRILRGKQTAEETARERAECIPAYAEHILNGNGGGWISAESGAEAAMPLSVEDRKALLRELPSDLFDRLRIFVNDLGNFRG